MLPQLVTAGVVGALSPAAILSAIMLLASRRPVANTVACLLGWTVVLVALGLVLQLVFGDHEEASGPSAKAAVGFMVGLLLIAFALRTLLGARHPLQRAALGERPAPQMPAWMHRLETIKTWQALVFGMGLIVVSPADLAAYFGAVQALIGADMADSERAIVFVVLLLAIDSCIWLPLLVYVCLPRRADRILAAAKDWIVAHQGAVAGWSAAFFGVVMVANSIASLP